MLLWIYLSLLSFSLSFTTDLFEIYDYLSQNSLEATFSLKIKRKMFDTQAIIQVITIFLRIKTKGLLSFQFVIFVTVKKERHHGENAFVSWNIVIYKNKSVWKLFKYFYLNSLVFSSFLKIFYLMFPLVINKYKNWEIT